MYLCHSFCELGATPLGSVLDDMRTFLVANPGAVLVVINQDYVKPEDFVGAVRDAGLEPVRLRRPGDRHVGDAARDDRQREARRLPGGEPGGRGAVVPPGLQGITEETPYAFSKVPQLTRPGKLPKSCEPNRGPEGAPLFLVNHWVTTDPVPLPSNARR